MWRRLGSPRQRAQLLAGLSAEQTLEVAYELLLHRKPDESGLANFVPGLRDGSLSPAALAESILASSEWWTGVVFGDLLSSLHFSRGLFVRSLPRARRILDLGGTSLGSSTGAMVTMGYPYQFEEMVVVDLPSSDRHELYREISEREVAQSPLGPVSFRYHSMSDLSAYPDASFDLVYSGQSIEHVPFEEADTVLAEAARVLEPGGHLGLDTPNARVCRLESEQFINPDHDYEYTHHEMLTKLRASGLEILEAKGLNYAGGSVASGTFSVEEVASMRGVFSDIEDCYLLSYLCRKPPG